MRHLPTSSSCEQDCNLEAIAKDLPNLRKLEEKEGREKVRVCAVEIETNKYYFLPYYEVESGLSEGQNLRKIVRQQNIDTIKEVVEQSQKVLELTESMVTD